MGVIEEIVIYGILLIVVCVLFKKMRAFFKKDEIVGCATCFSRGTCSGTCNAFSKVVVKKPK